MSIPIRSHAPDRGEFVPSVEVSTTAGSGKTALPTDELLVVRTQAGDVEAFEHLVERHEQTLSSIARRFVRDEHDVQEIIQDVFITTWRRLSGFEGRAQLSSWLYRVTVNASLMHLRARARRPRVLALPEGASARDVMSPQTAIPCDARFRPDVQLEARELRGVIQHAIDGLPAGLRSVFDLRELQGWSTRQTGRLLGLSEAAVKTRLLRARLHLRRQIEQYQVAEAA
jgi:RNA polymerase sigma-70 factor (ECF subfamily)